MLILLRCLVVASEVIETLASTVIVVAAAKAAYESLKKR